MRLDQWLSKVCLLKSRSQAKNGCQSGKITLAGASVKESHEVQVGELVEILFPGKALTVGVLQIPTGNVSRKQAPDYYEILEERLIKRDHLL